MDIDNFVSQKNSQYIFLKYGLSNRNEEQCSQISGLGMGMKNSVPNFWDWKWEWKTVFPTQVGKELTKESCQMMKICCWPIWAQRSGKNFRPKKRFSQILGSGMGMKNNVPNWICERIDKIVLGKIWERGFPLMPVSRTDTKLQKFRLSSHRKIVGW